MRKGSANTLLISTPEGIAFSLLLAGPVTRFLAWAVDMACIAAMCLFGGMALGFLGLISIDFARAVLVLALFVIQIGYGIVCEWFWRGQTVGKRLLRLRVMDVQGLRLQFSQVVIRNLLRLVDMLPAFYLIGGLACLISRRAQRLGDLAANSIVVRNPKIRGRAVPPAECGQAEGSTACAAVVSGQEGEVETKENELPEAGASELAALITGRGGDGGGGGPEPAQRGEGKVLN